MAENPMTYVDRWAVGVDAAYDALQKQFQSKGSNPPMLYDAPTGKPLIGIDGVIDLADIVAAVLKAADAVEGR